MTKDEIVEEARAALARLGQAKVNSLGVELKRQSIEGGKQARADAAKIALRIATEHEELAADELTELHATYRQLSEAARRYEQRAERYKQFKLKAQQVVFNRSLR